jgi:hypothetical protein
MRRKRTKKSVSPTLAKGMSKAAFVRSFPTITPAKEVVAKAKSQGIQLTDAYVYNVRATSKVVKKSAAKKKRSRTNTKVARAGSPEERLRAAAAELGLARAISLLRAEHARLQKLKSKSKARRRS